MHLEPSYTKNQSQRESKGPDKLQLTNKKGWPNSNLGPISIIKRKK
jgi:hypothetical protein